jgi:hypothetical protein
MTQRVSSGAFLHLTLATMKPSFFLLVVDFVVGLAGIHDAW